jgi:hypothetical protein
MQPTNRRRQTDTKGCLTNLNIGSKVPEEFTAPIFRKFWEYSECGDTLYDDIVIGTAVIP